MLQVLQDDPYVFADHIEVVTEHGMVRLQGIALDYGDLQRTLLLARRVAGRRRVVNEIEVMSTAIEPNEGEEFRLCSTCMIFDESRRRVRSQVLAVPLAFFAVPRRWPRVQRDRQKATLSNGPTGKRPRACRTRWTRTEILYARHIFVHADSGVVRLTGYVWDPPDLFEAKSVAELVPGVSSVVNDLELNRNGMDNSGVTR